MLQNLFSTIVASSLLILWVVAVICFIVRTIKNNRAPVITVKAVVVDKHTEETFSKYSGTGTRKKFVVVFSVMGKKLPFYVSEFSYSGYRITEKGTLTYQGNKIIGFK